MLRKRELLRKYKKLLLKEINHYYLNNKRKGRKNKFSNEFYLNHILKVLFYNYSWESFFDLECDSSTIRKKFYKWRDIGIFYSIYVQLYEKYIKLKLFKDVFIDSSFLQNINCSESVFFSYKMKSKKGLKLHILSDLNCVPICYEISHPSDSDNSYINTLIKKFRKSKKINGRKNIIGDKAYCSLPENKKKFYNNGFTLIVEKKKNQIGHSVFNNKIKPKMKNRFKVEVTFFHIKNTYKRLNQIYDSKIINFETFLIMAISCQILRQ